MKLKLDLLPNERKKIKRDNKALIACVILVFITFLWYIPTKKSMNSKVNVLVKEISDISKKILVKQGEVDNIQAILASPLNIPDDIKYLMTFLGESSYSWYRFFDSIEDSANSSVWISDINKNEINDFYLIGEAKDNYYISDFYHNLMKKDNFEKVYLLSSEKKYNKEIDEDVYKFKIHVVLKEEKL
ncbi:MAG: PilN domain-containing protein [Candidatus Muirbacterium halophilum]|nr:PilN domain-containing protein [Candidatus Muirbacterium halophilum]MCK9475010.1 PilN domain-containing protein [Candidatus Muirbacterium halophilum]